MALSAFKHLILLSLNSKKNFVLTVLDDCFYKNAFMNEAVRKRYDSQILIHQAPCFSCISCPGKDILKSRFRADKNYSLTISSIVESYYATKGGSIFYFEI